MLKETWNWASWSVSGHSLFGILVLIRDEYPAQLKEHEIGPVELLVVISYLGYLFLFGMNTLPSWKNMKQGLLNC